MIETNYPCQYCSSEWQKIYHGGTCPKVKSIEYYKDGTVKKVEFHDKNQESKERRI